ncbi:MAG: formyltransferase family protein, partial [Candidatus Rokuibacteriota bacterium]
MTRARWAIFAYHTIGARALAALLARGEDVATVVTHADDPGEGDWFESVAELARVHRIRCLAPPSPNLPEVVETVRGLAPDLILSVWYRRLLGPELLAVPRVAALNLHGSLLPAYRGRAPLNWVLVNGETRTGVTLHHMTAAADAGDIVAQRPIGIEPDDTAFALYERMVRVGVELLLEAYPAVLANTAPRIPQDDARATTVPRRRPDDGRIEWTWPATRIFDMIRAVAEPYPGAFVGDGPARLRLWAASVRDDATSAAVPGTIVEVVPSRGIAVATG